MILGVSARTVPCLRPRLHPRHTWVVHPKATVEYLCEGQPGDSGQPPLFSAPLTPLSSRRRADAGTPSSSTRAFATATGQGTDQ